MTFQEQINSLGIGPMTTLEAANECLEQAGLSDGLPLVPPTQERIDEMLSGWKVRPEMLLPRPLMPSSISPSIWDIATSAVMAGCRREYMPVIVSALLAITEPDFSLLAVQSTTGSSTPVVIVHGPVAQKLGINGADNCMGQGHRANATIGRAVRLVLQNVGGAIPGVSDMATLGQPGKYTWCFAENQAASPLPPFHAEYAGLEPESSAVTVLAVSGSQEVVLGGSGPEMHAHVLRQAIRHRRGRSQTLVIMPPEVAQDGATKEWDRRRWQELMWGNPPEQTTGGGTPDDILVIVAGGVGIKAAVLPGSQASRAITKPVRPL